MEFYKLVGVVFFGSIIFYFSALFVFYTLFKIVSVDVNAAYIVAGVITGFIAVSIAIIRSWSSLFSQILYYPIAIWMGTLLYTFIFSIVYHIWNAISELSVAGGLIVIFVPSGLLIMYGWISTCFIRVNHVDITIPGIAQNLKIAHISDMHLGPIYNRRHSQNVVQAILKENPDMVAIMHYRWMCILRWEITI